MTDDEIKENEKVSTASEEVREERALKPGARLAAYREKAGISVEQVASRLKMTNRQVQLIEADNYESLYSMAIARGFVRAYAKFLNVDPEPLVAAFPSDKPDVCLPITQPTVQSKRGINEAFAGNRQPFKSRRDFPGKSIVLLVAVIVVIGGMLALWRNGWQPSLRSSGKAASTSASREVSPNQGAAKEVSKKSPATSGSVSTELAAPRTVISEDIQKPAEAASQSAAPGSAASAVAAPRVSVSAPEEASAVKQERSSETAAQMVKGALVLRAQKDSWVQILRSDSTVLYERTLRPGQAETLAISEPVAVTIGYAPGIEATYRGKQLELKTTANSTVARVNLK